MSRFHKLLEIAQKGGVKETFYNVFMYSLSTSSFMNNVLYFIHQN